MLYKGSRYSIADSYTDGNRVLLDTSSRTVITINKRGYHYRVKEGDTLDNIAFKFYGKAEKWWAIADSNNIFDPFSLIPGSILDIPL